MTQPARELAADRRALQLEIAVVLAVTFGMSAANAMLELIDSVLRGLRGRIVALNPMRSPFDLVNLGLNLTSIAQLLAWGGLGLYLLWRSGITPRQIGLGRPQWRADVLGGLGLAALIGLPGLGLYFVARVVGMSAEVVPSALTDTWWRVPVLLWPLVIAHGIIDTVAFVGYALAARHLGWLR
jgi:hypothetical protein